MGLHYGVADLGPRLLGLTVVAAVTDSAATASYMHAPLGHVAVPVGQTLHKDPPVSSSSCM